MQVIKGQREEAVMSEILPKATERIYAPYKINAVVEVLAEQGISAQLTLAGTGLSSGQLNDPNALTSIKQFLTVCENAIALRKILQRHLRSVVACTCPHTGCTVMH